MKDIETTIASEIVPFVIDLFAGAGGFSLGAIHGGFEIRAAVEQNGYAVQTYKKNINNVSGKDVAMIEGDIMDISPFDLMQEGGLSCGQCDLLLGGPPCQGFSSHRLGHTGVDDSRNQLLMRYFAFVETVRPRTFLLENVPGLLHSKHTDYLDRFIATARDHEYEVIGPIVLNAKDFGVPQNRKRVFILGISNEVSNHGLRWPPKPTHVKPEVAQQVGLPSWRTAADAFSDKSGNSDPNDIHMNHGDGLIEVFRSTPLNGGSRSESCRVLPCHKRHQGHRDVYGRICMDTPSPTMTTGCINPSKGRFVHPFEHHGITARQAARLQTFPDDFIFEGGITAMGVQIGNAVPVKLAEVLCTHLMNTLMATAHPFTRPDHDA